MTESGCSGREKMSIMVAVSLLSLLLHAALGFPPCPTHCQCYKSHLVDCRTRGLDRVPPGVPHSTWLLDLRGNELVQVHNTSFEGLWSLKILLMSNNSIAVLQPQSLSSLQFLERLDLSWNRLQTLPEDFSCNMAALLELQLHHNLLERLDSSSLRGLENLQNLDLSYNRIQAVDCGAFRGLSRLNVLNLQGNRLRELQAELLSRQQGLDSLLLGHNNISLIQAGALGPLRSLTLLDLRGNRLERVRFKTFVQLHTKASTTHLQMSFNRWTCDCELQRVFSKIRHVRDLHVDDYEDIRCHAPAQRAGKLLASLDSQLCIAETASVLVIVVTVMLAVVGTLIKAEHNRKKNAQTAEDMESERQER